MNPAIKYNPAQKHINKFFAIQARRISREDHKNNSNKNKDTDKSNIRRNKGNTN